MQCPLSFENQVEMMRHVEYQEERNDKSQKEILSLREESHAHLSEIQKLNFQVEDLSSQ